jgi:lipid A 4'-phosphatase
MNKYSKWLLPILFVVLIAPFSTTIDLDIAQAFYNYYDGFAVDHPFYLFNYYYMYIPAWIAVLFALYCLIYSFRSGKHKEWRKPATLVIAVFLLTPLLLVNMILKENWGRPRPRQIEMYGGNNPYRPFYTPYFQHSEETLKSFPSGHASMGFFFFAVAIAGKRLKNRPLHILGYVLAFGLGVSLSISRIAMGGHFFTDVLFAALLVWYTTLIVDWLLYRQREN